jgi:hypothetical protein
MISGVFVTGSSPFVKARVRVPRLVTERTLTFLMDTGADRTSVHLRDALQLVGYAGLRTLRKLGNISTLGGISGSADYYVVSAQIIFTHDDGTEQGFNTDLRIVKPARRRSKKRANQLRIPSLLGKDVMSRFAVVFDWPHRAVFLDHS